MDQATIAYWLTWVGTGAWVVCFWWMHRISTRQDALLTELRELARTQHDILREVHPDVGEIKEHVVTEQGEKIDEIAQQVMQVAGRVTRSEASGGDRDWHGCRETIAGQDSRALCRSFPAGDVRQASPTRLRALVGGGGMGPGELVPRACYWKLKLRATRRPPASPRAK
jgi:hypothetical protein